MKKNITLKEAVALIKDGSSIMIGGFLGTGAPKQIVDALVESGVKDLTMAENGREALAVLKGDSSFDMVLSDLWMPEMDGRELVQAIRADAKLSRLPVYLLTADVEARNHPELNGFTGILIKPVTLKKVQSLFE